MTFKNKVVLGYLERYPSAPSQTLARIIYKENPLIWMTFDAVYCMVRRFRGNQGNRNRQLTKVKEHFRPNQAPGFNLWKKIR